MKSKTALVAANVQRPANSAEPPCPLLGSGVVGALVEEGACLLPCTGVVVEDEPVETELSARGLSRGIGDE